MTTMDKKIILLFPGQGAQYSGMGKDFYDNFPVVKQVFDEADDILGYSLTEIMFEDPENLLVQTKYSQVAIFTMSIALLEVFRDKFPDVIPMAAAGLSLGEYSALCASNRLSFKEALKLVQVRGEAMQRASENHPGSLSAVLGLDAQEVEKALQEISGTIGIANLNCPKQVVISGSLKALKLSEEALKNAGAKRVIPLDVSGAFHSPLMNDAQKELKPHIEAAVLNRSEIKMALNVSGNLESDETTIKQLMIRQVVETTLWQECIASLEGLSPDLYLEIGPSKTLKGMNKKNKVVSETYNLETVSDLNFLSNKLTNLATK